MAAGRRPKAAHHRGTHQVRARHVVTYANNNPNQTCWRCGRTLDQHPPHRNGRPAFWTAGHIIDTVGPLAPEASTCNYSAGAKARDKKIERHSEVW